MFYEKTLILLLVSVLMLTASSSYAAEIGEEKALLSAMTEEECLVFISNQGVNIPIELQKYEKLGELVKEIICTVENNPEQVFAFNYHIVLEFANNIKIAVNTYYGRNGIRKTSDDPFLDFYDLQDNEIVGIWKMYS